MHSPDIAGIEKHSSIQTADETGPIFEIEKQFEVARLIEIRVGGTRGRESSGAHAAHGEGTHAIGTAHVELLAVGGCRGIAVTPNHTCRGMCHEMRTPPQLPCFSPFGFYLEKLCKGILKHFLIFLVPPPSGYHVA